jgi:hypothetical protein
LYGETLPTYVLGDQRLFETGIHIEANWAGSPAAETIWAALSSHHRLLLV